MDPSATWIRSFKTLNNGQTEFEVEPRPIRKKEGLQEDGNEEEVEVAAVDLREVVVAQSGSSTRVLWDER